MSASKGSHPKPKLKRVPLKDLAPGSASSSRLSPRARRALLRHIEATGLYPPLIVRPYARGSGKFEIIDGRQRAEVLGELGFPDARCEVWFVDAHQGELYAATLNHLRAGVDAAERAQQIHRLIARLGSERTAELLGLTPAAIRQQLVALEPLDDRSEDVAPLDLHTVVFHLPRAEVQELTEALRELAPSSSRRGEALMRALRTAAKRKRTSKE